MIPVPGGSGQPFYPFRLFPSVRWGVPVLRPVPGRFDVSGRRYGVNMASRILVYVPYVLDAGVPRG